MKPGEKISLNIGQLDILVSEIVMGLHFIDA